VACPPRTAATPIKAKRRECDDAKADSDHIEA
jgi:hypothetical protein